MSDQPATAEESEGHGSCSIIVSHEVLTAIDQHMSDDTAVEYGGVLVGIAEPLLAMVVITAYEPLPPEFASDTVTFTNETWDYMNRLVTARHPAERIVGWYHSHPRFGIFLSAHDIALHTVYFYQPWQVAYVFDPVQHERGFFGWLHQDIVRIPSWETTIPASGLSTTLPASVPAHGEFMSARLGGTRRVDVYSDTEVLKPLAAVQPEAAPTVGPRRGARPPRRGRLIAALVAAAVVIGAVVAFVVSRNGDTANSVTTPSAPVTAAAATPTLPVTASPVTTSPVTTLADTTSTSTAVTTSTAVSSTTAVATTTTPTTTSASVVSAPTSAANALPSTPREVTAPAARVGAGVLACVANDAGVFTPTSECFVPLASGNVLVYGGGELRCADPDGAVLTPATSFQVGFESDPSVIFADGALVPKCGDLSYARNVLAGGAASLDGLCGSPATSIDDKAVRCFAQNPATGAILDIVNDPNIPTNLIGSCHSAAGKVTPVPLFWTKSTVDVTWRLVSTVFDPAAKQFVVSATKNGVPTTAKADCS